MTKGARGTGAPRRRRFGQPQATPVTGYELYLVQRVTGGDATPVDRPSGAPEARCQVTARHDGHTYRAFAGVWWCPGTGPARG